MIPKSFIADVIERTDIISVIQSRIELKKRGDNYSACCPFHSEKTPSFSVSHSKQFYYCFGCGAHGDVIAFLMAYEHLPFFDALTDLAHQLGMTVPVDNQSTETTHNEEFYSLLLTAQKYYEEELKKSPPAIHYLKNRGLTGQIAKTFGIGYAPNEWGFISKKTSDLKGLVTTGMVIEKQNRHYDRFRDRIMFPIRDIRGRVIGFGGRTLTNEIPKYLNSPETPIFHKNQTLYGLYEMFKPHHKVTRLLVVEGYLDVISLAQHDIHYAAATLGTAVNSKHIQILLRHVKDIIFCFDGDNAGKKAAWKALTISLPFLRDGLNFRFLFLPEKEDPDSLIHKIGRESFEKLIDTALELPDVFFSELEKDIPLSSLANIAAFSKKAHECLETMPEGIYKNLLLDQLSVRVNIPRQQLNTSFKKEESTIKKNLSKNIKSSHLNPTLSAIQLLLHHPELSQFANHIPKFKYDENNSDKTLLRKLIDHCIAIKNLSINDFLNEVEDTSQKTLIATMATQTLRIPLEGVKAEFLGALQRLYEQDEAEELSQLIEKARQSELNTAEKQRLKALLAKKQERETARV